MHTPADESPTLTRPRPLARRRMTETPLHMIRSNRAIPGAGGACSERRTLPRTWIEPTPIGPAFDDRSVRGYYIDFRSKTTSAVAGNAEALPAR